MQDDGRTPVYSAADTVAVVLDFLTFLTTLHRDRDHLYMPPPGGWPGYTPENCADFKSDLVVEVMRNLPFLGGEATRHDSLGQIHYKCCLLDYTTFDREELTEQEDLWEREDEESDDESAPDHVFILAAGYESGGRTVFIDALEGKAVEAEIRGGNENSIWDLKEYFEDLKNKYRNLEIVPIPHAEMKVITIADLHRFESDETVSEEEVLMQSDRWWGSDLDIRYTRQLYREFGWPNDFQRDEAFRELCKVMDERMAR
ncbi:hypothetical protein [Actinoplanes derwentensis]|uniref:SUKH-4 immunity protein n=1 Tax=Actinoplanes derwentensis TaxID=113562 RepID=A0A1H1UPE4_9ACTN|nr:hypothetical protein [Actinoplanes derwentensis]GID88121.1 hypothetical protein Ade03nite_70450 [Actinoplanes derwentensis]SDS74150.1 hypothetical protein SAMN04489716_1498 [Actinoplanes derwentensis]